MQIDQLVRDQIAQIVKDELVKQIDVKKHVTEFIGGEAFQKSLNEAMEGVVKYHLESFVARETEQAIKKVFTKKMVDGLVDSQSEFMSKFIKEYFNDKEWFENFLDIKGQNGSYFIDIVYDRFTEWLDKKLK